MKRLRPIILIAMGLITGSIIHNRQVIINYFLSDFRPSFLHAIIAFWMIRGLMALFNPRLECSIFGDNLWRTKDDISSNSRNSEKQSSKSNSEKKSTSKQTRDLEYDAVCQEIGIHPTHTFEQLKRHWKLTCKQWHPDTGGSHTLWIRKQYAYEMLLGRAREREGLH